MSVACRWPATAPGNDVAMPAGLAEPARQAVRDCPRLALRLTRPVNP